MTKKEMEITSLVYEIIKYGKKLGLPYVTRRQIINEAMKTQLKRNLLKKYPKDKHISVLERQIDQALQMLKKKGLITKKGYGRWTVKKYKVTKPKLCSHLQKIDDSTFYCPVRKAKIPLKTAYSLCIQLTGTDYTTRGKRKVKTPVCPGFITEKSTPLTIEYSRKLIEIKEGKHHKKKKYVGGV